MAAAGRSAFGRGASASRIRFSAQARLMAVGRVASSRAMGRRQPRIRRVGPQRHGHAIGGRRPDQRRAAHPHVADGRGKGRKVGQVDDAHLMRQPALVDDADTRALSPMERGVCRRSSCRKLRVRRVPPQG